jgi:acetate---CoA ligase (ADP-forming)
VALDLKNRDAVQAAAEALAASARAAQPSARIDGFLVQEMVSGIEAIVGARDDPLYGPLLLVGSGGVLVELAADAALRLLPVTAHEVSTMVDGLKLAKRLSGFRGQPAADRAAFEAAVLALARFFLDHRARIKDVEINPLMVRANNQSPAHDPQSKVQKPAAADSGVVAVDVRVLWREDGEGS